jgi:hypothetical protein
MEDIHIKATKCPYCTSLVIDTMILKSSI